MVIEKGQLEQTVINSILKEANVCTEQGLFLEAENCYKDSLAELEKMPETEEIKAQKRLIKNKIKEVNEAWLMQLEEIPTTSQIKAQKESIKERIKGLEEELKSEEKVIHFPSKEKKGEGKECYKKACNFMERRSYKKAIDEFKKVLAVGYRAEESLESIIQCYREEGLIVSCTQFLKQLLGNKEPSPTMNDKISYEIGELSEEMGNYDDALFYFEKIKNKKVFRDLEERIKKLQLRKKLKNRFDYLLLKGIISKEILEEATIKANKENKSVEDVLINRYNVNKDEIVNSLSLFYGCPFIYFSPSLSVPVDLLKGLKMPYLRANFWVPIKKEGNAPVVVIDDPKDMGRIDVIKNLLHTDKVKVLVSTRGEIEKFVDYLSWHQSLAEEEEEWAELEAVEEISETDIRVINFVNRMFLEAWSKLSSDIHVEPEFEQRTAMIRMRIDGMLRPFMRIPKVFCRAVVNRIKIMANLDIAERRLPQDGKIFFKYGGKRIGEERIATVPVVGGDEMCVVRLLLRDIPYKLHDIGLTEHNLNMFKKALLQPQGLILCVGPTGSGKTTTLHGVLDHINRPEVKIWTAEDPVELTFPGLCQCEIMDKIGRTYPRLLKAFLRADPDIIFIGEIRDRTSVENALAAALTGHLVLSTLHTNSAPETIPRFLQFGIDPYDFADSLSLVISQRLFRMLCNHCKEPYHPTKEEYDELVRRYGGLELLHQHHGDRFDYTADLTLYRHKGCSECMNTGYWRRWGIHEVMLVSENMKELIMKGKGLTIKAAREQAIKDGMRLIIQDGIRKVLGGITDFHEIRRCLVVM